MPYPPSHSPCNGRVAVVGSLNFDHFARVERLPGTGETVAADRIHLSRGGKGANQAISAARQGCEVILIGAVGSDEVGTDYLRALEKEGVSTQCIRTVAGPTGAAHITVDRAGENTIVVAAGANAALRRDDIARWESHIVEADVLLAQFEVPVAALLEAVRVANEADIPVVLNPSPILPAFPWDEIRTDYLVANERESFELLGFPAMPSTELEVRRRLVEMRVGHLIVTRGGEETWIFPVEGGLFAIPVLSVLPVDTVGAGDAFAGCFAARIARGDGLDAALAAANCAGALTTLGAGAQDPIPDWQQVERHLQFLES